MTRAFAADSELLTLERITRGDLPLPSEIFPDYPRGLETVVMKALAVDPDQRYQDACTMGRDLEAIGHGLGLALGHSTVVDFMDLLAGHRRLARSSDQVMMDAQRAVVAELTDTETAPLSVSRPIIATYPRLHSRHRTPTAHIRLPPPESKSRVSQLVWVALCAIMGVVIGIVIAVAGS
jgi:hypothetical protein